MGRCLLWVTYSNAVNREDPQLDNNHFVDIVMDVLSERGYHVSYDSRAHHEPVRVDLNTGKIELAT